MHLSERNVGAGVTLLATLEVLLIARVPSAWMRRSASVVERRDSMAADSVPKTECPTAALIRSPLFAPLRFWTSQSNCAFIGRLAGQRPPPRPPTPTFFHPTPSTPTSDIYARSARNKQTVFFSSKQASQIDLPHTDSQANTTAAVRSVDGHLNAH
jgi:hypothetical protein